MYTLQNYMIGASLLFDFAYQLLLYGAAALLLDVRFILNLNLN